MAERRQAHRREPIIVEVRGIDHEAHPLPWQDRNDLGNEIIEQYQDTTNEAIQSYASPETGTPQLFLRLNDKLKDPIKILEMGYPNDNVEDFRPLEWSEILELIGASCEVNELSHLMMLIDPNFPTPKRNGGANTSGNDIQTDTPKMPSSPDSSYQGSAEMTSEPSPMPRSVPSSSNSDDLSGTSDIGDLP